MYPPKPHCLSLVFWKNWVGETQEFTLQSLIKYIGSNKLRPPSLVQYEWKPYYSYKPEIKKWNLTLLNAAYKPVLHNSMFWIYWDKYSSFWEGKKEKVQKFMQFTLRTTQRALSLQEGNISMAS